MKTREEIEELFNKAENDTLPPDFQEWDLCDDKGWTVAHQAALFEHLPQNFDKWDLKDKRGITVRNIANDVELTWLYPDEFYY